MSKFKVGDRVTAQDTVHGGTGTLLSPYLSGWEVLLDNAPHRPPNFSGWYFRDNELELIPTFKTGDRVRTVVEFSGVPTGAVGTIQSNEYPYFIRVVLDDYPYNPNSPFSAWPYQSRELELIDKTPDPRDRALDEIHDIVKCVFGRRYDAIQAIEVQIPNILQETGRL